MKNIQPWRLEIKDKWYANLSTMALNLLCNAGVLEDPDKAREMCRNGEIRRLRNCGKVTFNQICVALGITIHSKISNTCCPHCGKSFGIQLHKLKSSEVELG